MPASRSVLWPLADARPSQDAHHGDHPFGAAQGCWGRTGGSCSVSRNLNRRLQRHTRPGAACQHAHGQPYQHNRAQPDGHFYAHTDSHRHANVHTNPSAFRALGATGAQHRATGADRHPGHPGDSAGIGDRHRWYGLIGIWAGTQPASWPLVITGESAAGSPAIVERRQLRVSARQFEIDAVTMTQDTLNLVLDTEATQRENNLLASLLAPRTPDRLWQGTFQRPVKGEVTTTYGQRRSYNGGPALEYHGGLDLAADEGTPIAAANSGRVVFAGPLKIRGNVVIIDHGWGLYSGYFHMSAIQVTVGQQVERGQTIGLLGSTGFSTGPHVHWQVWLGGYPVDPTFLEQWQLPG